jgi:dCMP deaminase
MSQWDLRFLEMAKHVASWSKDPSTKVGAVIFDEQKRVVSLGYNGFPKGVDDDPKRYADRELKYRMVVHAEANAMIFAQRNLAGCSIATWPFMSCSACAAMLIQSGIKRCVAPRLSEDLASRWSESCAASTMMFAEAGVELAFYDNV